MLQAKSASPRGVSAKLNHLSSSLLRFAPFKSLESALYVPQTQCTCVHKFSCAPSPLFSFGNCVAFDEPNDCIGRNAHTAPAPHRRKVLPSRKPSADCGRFHGQGSRRFVYREQFRHSEGNHPRCLWASTRDTERVFSECICPGVPVSAERVAVWRGRGRESEPGTAEG
jgi:hypothetical protein